jgi:hypothetical protein
MGYQAGRVHSGQSYRKLRRGRHTFGEKAIDHMAADKASTSSHDRSYGIPTTLVASFVICWRGPSRFCDLPSLRTTSHVSVSLKRSSKLVGAESPTPWICQLLGRQRSGGLMVLMPRVAQNGTAGSRGRARQCSFRQPPEAHPQSIPVFFGAGTEPMAQGLMLTLRAASWQLFWPHVCCYSMWYKEPRAK